MEESLSTFNAAVRKTKGFDKFNNSLATEIEQGIKDLMIKNLFQTPRRYETAVVRAVFDRAQIARVHG